MRFHRAIAIAAAFVGATLAAGADPWSQNAGTYFASQRAPVGDYGAVPKYLTRNNHIPIILAEARRQGVPERLALKVCKIESNCNLYATGPKTRHGRHYGVYQIRPTSARRFGYAGGSLHGMAGLKYGMAHLADCHRRSGGSEAIAARCHVAGPGALGRSIAPWAERYAQRYTRQVINAQPPLWAGKLQVAWRQ